MHVPTFLEALVHTHRADRTQASDRTQAGLKCMEVWQPRANRTCEQVWAEETPGGCLLGRVRSDETLGMDVVVRSLYKVPGNVERIVEL